MWNSVTESLVGGACVHICRESQWCRGTWHAHLLPRAQGSSLPCQWRYLLGDLLSLSQSIRVQVIWCWEPARPLQGSFGPSGPEMPKKSRKCLPGPVAWNPEKVSKKSRGQSGKSPESLERVSGECFWTVPALFGHSVGVPGHFFGISGPLGPKDRCKGRVGSQVWLSSPRSTVERGPQSNESYERENP